MPCLQEYLLIDSEIISVEGYSRGKGRMWLYYPYAQGDIIASITGWGFILDALFVSGFS